MIVFFYWNKINMPNNPNKLSRPNEFNARKSRAGRISARRLLERLKPAPSLESRIDATTGPFIEVGAVPSSTRSRDTLIDLYKIKKPLVTSNIYQPQTIETYFRHSITGESKIISHRDEAPRSRWFKARGADFKVVGSGNNWADPVVDKIDLIADATDLPFEGGSIGALYAIALHPDAEIKFVSDEAPRVLEPGGVLILDSVKSESLANDNPYLDTIRLETHGKGEPLTNYAAVRNSAPYQTPRLGQS
jgi:hypothetical protein